VDGGWGAAGVSTPVHGGSRSLALAEESAVPTDGSSRHSRAGDFSLLQALAELWVGNQAGMLVLLEAAPVASQALLVPALPGAIRQKGQPQRAQTQAVALGGVFHVYLCQAPLEHFHQKRALLAPRQVSLLDEE